jgi:pimeloyl-ACP methyl ester carboxylesterase
MEELVTFASGGLTLAGVLHLPDARGSRERRPAFLVLHGFGSSKDSGGSVASAKLFAELGYAALRFDMRGCGQSEGVRGRVICLEQVEDTRSALTFLTTRPEVDADRIGVMGASFGAAVAVYTAGVDQRVAACVSAGGWGDGEKKFRKQHESPEAWARFTAMLAEGRRRRAQTGESIMVPRYDIVPIPPALRGSVAPGSIMEFPFEVVESMYAFRANDVVGKISPRPLLLLHPANDSVTPTEQSIGGRPRHRGAEGLASGSRRSRGPHARRARQPRAGHPHAGRHPLAPRDRRGAPRRGRPLRRGDVPVSAVAPRGSRR